MKKRGCLLILIAGLAGGMSARAENHYPIILAHGLAGGEYVFDLYPYWGGADGHLRRQGLTVYTPSVTPYNDSYVRGEELAERLRDFLVAQGEQCQGELGGGGLRCTTKVHIIGHSQGGLDARRVARLAGPGMVRSVLTISTPHQGSCLASELIIANGLGFHFVEFFINLFGRLTYDPERPGHRPIDGRAAMQFLDPFRASCLLGECAALRDINVFNAEHPMEDEIDYFSVRTATRLPRLAVAPLAWLTAGCGGLSGRGLFNDGIVELYGQDWGEGLCYRAGGLLPPCFNCDFCSDPLGLDHLDGIGVPLTLFNHQEFFLTAARRLRALPE